MGEPAKAALRQATGPNRNFEWSEDDLTPRKTRALVFVKKVGDRDVYKKVAVGLDKILAACAVC